MSAEQVPTIYLVSDGTCRTCEQVIQAVLVQFERPSVRLIRRPNVRGRHAVKTVIQQAVRDRALVAYTLVSEEARKAMEEANLERPIPVPVVDLLGPLMRSLYDLFQSTPMARPGILYDLNKALFDRIDAVEYTLHHDDGCGIHELAAADVVLVGVSRASKSTTCFYLAYSGIRAANVPLIHGSDPSPELLKLDPRRIIGLTTNPHRLKNVRDARLRSWGMCPHADYASKKQIARELMTANELMAKYGWRCVDVSYKAVEEVAREVMQVLQEAGVEVGQRAATPSSKGHTPEATNARETSTDSPAQPPP
jgi:regulator of PEP synthase PpsR (kinase-PPPase family)